jgi:protein-L-isoaspartate(D-aspartate) O-methyltransferase
MSRAFFSNICLAVLGAAAIVALALSLRSPLEHEPTIASAAARPSGSYESQRLEMVNRQIAARGIKDKNILAAMRKVPRHEYVPRELRPEAYSDWPLPIGCGQTISQPYIVALMTELLQPKKSDRILEIGTGSGYQAAVLAEIVDKVWTIEIIKELGEKAKKILEEKYPDKVKVKVADGYYGWEEGAPFDGIIVTCAANNIPAPLIKQLKEGGRMVIPMESLFFSQNLIVVEKKEGGDIVTRNVCAVAFVPMTGAIRKPSGE